MNSTTRKIRTVAMNERGQIVIPEDIRKDFGIESASTLVLIESEGEIVIKRELDVFQAIDDDKFWKAISKESMKNTWHKEDKVWDKIYKSV
ncbi:MAG TPA: AbrB/MazE/SpoVT family DNA-binding domain-containing protein [archaeon]|nr:AbrB/MazE/SpoVT family DNA-binding domain-containing protein [archaeon]